MSEINWLRPFIFVDVIGYEQFIPTVDMGNNGGFCSPNSPLCKTVVQYPATSSVPGPVSCGECISGVFVLLRGLVKCRFLDVRLWIINVEVGCGTAK